MSMSRSPLTTSLALRRHPVYEHVLREARDARGRARRHAAARLRDTLPQHTAAHATAAHRSTPQHTPPRRTLPQHTLPQHTLPRRTTSGARGVPVSTSRCQSRPPHFSHDLPMQSRPPDALTPSPCRQRALFAHRCRCHCRCHRRCHRCCHCRCHRCCRRHCRPRCLRVACAAPAPGAKCPRALGAAVQAASASRPPRPPRPPRLLRLVGAARAWRPRAGRPAACPAWSRAWAPASSPACSPAWARAWTRAGGLCEAGAAGERQGGGR